MGFIIGQSVIHPSHGAGTIVAFQEKELVKGFQRYYVIEFIHNRLTVHVPAPRIEQIGVRPVMPVARITGVMETLESPRSIYRMNSGCVAVTSINRSTQVTLSRLPPQYAI